MTKFLEQFYPLMLLGAEYFPKENIIKDIHKDSQSEESKEYYLKKAEEKRLKKREKRYKNK